MTEPTRYTVTIDTEEEWDWDGGWPVERVGVTNARVLPRFQALCAKFGVRPTYFTNLAILQNDESRATLQEVGKDDGVEIGMHIHPWNTPPLASDTTVTPRATFLRNLPPDVIRAKLTSVYSEFQRHGLKPTSFRGGRYSSGGVVHEFLQERGFVAECSVVPFTTWPDDGAPDYRHRDLAPARIEPAAAGQSALWELPLTLAYSRRPFRLWQRALQTIEATALRNLRLIGIAERLGIVRRVWLNFEIADPYDWTGFLKLLRRAGARHVCFTVHSSSLAAGPGPYTRSAADEQRIFQQIERVFATLSGWPEFVPATASEVARHLEQEYACTGN